MESKMTSSTIIMLAMMVCCLNLILTSPIVNPEGEQLDHFAVTGLADPVQRTEANEFIQSQRVTDEEIQEYNRLTGFKPDGEDVGEGRMLGFRDIFDFWNWRIFDGFRNWILRKRGASRPQSPMVMFNNQHY